MSTGANKAAQTRKDQSGGAQMVGGMKPVDRARVPAFQGKSGQGDNQSTNRGKGRT
jgi:hypothetical protein